MTCFQLSTIRSLSGAAILVAALGAGSAFAQGAPVKLSVGNGAPLLGNNASGVGVGILTSQPNGTPTSVRLLGTEKTAGVYTTAVKGPNRQPTQAQVMTPIDGVLAPAHR